MQNGESPKLIHPTWIVALPDFSHIQHHFCTFFHVISQQLLFSKVKKFKGCESCNNGKAWNVLHSVTLPVCSQNALFQTSLLTVLQTAFPMAQVQEGMSVLFSMAQYMRFTRLSHIAARQLTRLGKAYAAFLNPRCATRQRACIYLVKRYHKNHVCPSNLKFSVFW